PVSGTLTVSARPATVTANDKTKVYGEANPALTATVVGAVGSDTLNYSLATTATASSNVGSFPMVVTLGSNPNYSVTSTDGSLTITARPVTITADAKTKVYGAADPAFTYQITSGSLVGSDAFTGSLDRTTGEAVGAYAISQ